MKHFLRNGNACVRSGTCWRLKSCMTWPHSKGGSAATQWRCVNILLCCCTVVPDGVNIPQIASASMLLTEVSILLHVPFRSRFLFSPVLQPSGFSLDMLHSRSPSSLPYIRLGDSIAAVVSQTNFTIPAALPQSKQSLCSLRPVVGYPRVFYRRSSSSS